MPPLISYRPSQAWTNGTVVLVGTNAGRFFSFSPSATSPPQGQKIPVTPGIPQGHVDHIVFPLATRAFAIYNSGGTILRYDGTAWSSADSGLPGGANTSALLEMVIAVPGSVPTIGSSFRAMTDSPGRMPPAACPDGCTAMA